MALTELGFSRPTYEDLLNAQIDRAKELFGEDIETSESTPLGKYIRLNVTDLAECYEILEKIYYARFPHTATGISLDRLCTFAGISRNPATYATHKVKFTGIAGEYVPSGFEVSAYDGSISFHLYNELLIGEDGTVEGIVECEEPGTIGNVPVGKIDTIVNPDANVESVEHLEIVSYGEEIEKDVDLRQRFDKAISGAGSGTANAISSAISRVPFVESVTVIENDTSGIVDGIPAHSFECFVLAPESQDLLIAEAIFSKKPLGIKSHGDVSVEVTDLGGATHTINFSRTIRVDIYMQVVVSVNSQFESDGREQIKSYIAECINNLKNGEDVYIPMLYSYVYKAQGIENVSIMMSTTSDSDTVTAENISISSSEVARIDTNNIWVVVSNG